MGSFLFASTEILQLIREAKLLHRMQIEIPEAAKMVMLQEVKFKNYFDELTFILQEYSAITSKILPVTAKIMEPLVRDVELKLVRAVVCKQLMCTGLH
jgi:dynein heavy chain